MKRFRLGLICLILVGTLCLSLPVAAENSVQPAELPAIHITLDDEKAPTDIIKDSYLTGSFSMQAEGFEAIDDLFVSIRGRGNSTWTLPKKPYQIKFDSRTELLGMGKAKKWILLANYWDKTLMRNYISYTMARAVGSDFVPNCQFVEVYINGEYRGNYLLTEKVELDKQRIDEDPDNGGVLFELEQLYRHADTGCADCFITDSGAHVTLKEPESDDGFTPEGFEALKEDCRVRLNNIEQAFQAGFDDYSNLVDVPSFVDWYIANELAKNFDAAFVTSSFCFFDEDGILHMGPLWDVDVCFGNQDVTYPGTVDNGLNAYNYRADKGEWYQMLFDDPAFVSLMKTRWKQLRDDGVLEQMVQDIDVTAAYLAESQKRDEQRWPDAMEVTEVRGKGTPYFTYAEEVQYFRQWLVDRIEWLNSQWYPDDALNKDIFSQRLVDWRTGSEVASSAGVKEGDVWSWSYSGDRAPNRSFSYTPLIFDRDLPDGQYYYEVVFETTPSPCSDAFMGNALAWGLLGGQERMTTNMATRVTYVTSQKDDDGWAVLRIPFTADSTQHVAYGCQIDCYNADVSIDSVRLFRQVPHALTGDTTLDGAVDATDALLVLKYTVGLVDLSQVSLLVSNVDGRDLVTPVDALNILKYSVSLIDAFEDAAGA